MATLSRICGMRVFALNYATSCGNVWHQMKKDCSCFGADGWKIRDGGSVVLRTVKCGGSNFTLQNSGENQKGKYKNTSKAATTSQEQNKNVIEILQTSANRSLHFAMWAPTPPKHTASFGPVFEYTRRWALLCTRVCVCASICNCFLFCFTSFSCIAQCVTDPSSNSLTISLAQKY